MSDLSEIEEIIGSEINQIDIIEIKDEILQGQKLKDGSKTPYRRNDDRNLVSFYLEQIGGIELMSPEETIELAYLKKAGDRSARDVMIAANLRLVASIAKDYIFKVRCMEFLDLIDEGTIGLILAVDYFEPEFKFKISTLATKLIHRCIKRAIDAREQLIRSKDAEKIFVLSLNQPVGEDSRLEHLIGGDKKTGLLEQLESDEIQKIVRTAVGQLPDEMPKKAIIIHFGLDGEEPVNSLAEISRRLGVSRWKVENAISKGLKALRDALKNYT